MKKPLVISPVALSCLVLALSSFSAFPALAAGQNAFDKLKDKETLKTTSSAYAAEEGAGDADKSNSAYKKKSTSVFSGKTTSAYGDGKSVAVDENGISSEPDYPDAKGNSAYSKTSNSAYGDRESVYDDGATSAYGEGKNALSGKSNVFTVDVEEGKSGLKAESAFNAKSALGGDGQSGFKAKSVVDGDGQSGFKAKSVVDGEGQSGFKAKSVVDGEGQSGFKAESVVDGDGQSGFKAESVVAGDGKSGFSSDGGAFASRIEQANSKDDEWRKAKSAFTGAITDTPDDSKKRGFGRSAY
ncbi:hypothetical protein VRRI112168_03455 [Vreelandella rituensis]